MQKSLLLHGRMFLQMKAVILAGGRGIRLGELTVEVPKPMITIGDRPLLHHQVDLLVSFGICDIILLVNYLKDPVINYFGDGSRFHARISYFEETEPLGTVGGIKAIEDLLTDDFMVLYGDVMMNMDLDRFIHFHQEKDSQCTLVLHPNDHPFDSDLVETSEAGRVIAFYPKPHLSAAWYHNLVNAGAYLMSPEILKFLEKGKKADFGKEVFPAILSQVRMYGYQTSEYLKDMGTPDRLDRVKHDLESGKILRSSYKYPQRAVFLDRDGVLNIERSYISNPEELEILDFVPAAIRKLNQSGYLSVVVTNQSAIARNLCTEEDVQTIHKKLETVLGEQGAWLDAIYYCPHHPDKGFPEENPAYKIDCDCRKPKTGMFQKAIAKFGIDTGKSYMIGDSERDIQAGINAGCITIGVRTGYGIRKTKLLPDYMFSNLAEAVDFIVDDPLRESFEKINSLYQDYRGSRPWVILIGGNARTGKSTLASYLRISFIKAGISVLQVALDNWILPEDKRSAAMDVYDRFQLKTIEKDMIRLISGHALERSTYANHPERKPVPLFYNPEGARIIIIEGVVALSSEIVRKSAMLKLFTQLDAVAFRRRIHDYYTWRGKYAGEIESLVEKREMDEYQVIEKESNLADMIINPTHT
jgi:D,D-heptose 1,7-bisphosphate phosphatase